VPVTRHAGIEDNSNRPYSLQELTVFEEDGHVKNNYCNANSAVKEALDGRRGHRMLLSMPEMSEKM
jgi:hypothetical protein